ncbi:MAG: alginate lyase family protein [Ectothiorhodospiraceae bacterium]|nr:alginate lyase family protein [Ectothiorhodospiraceae bacterium]
MKNTLSKNIKQNFRFFCFIFLGFISTYSVGSEVICHSGLWPSKFDSEFSEMHKVKLDKLVRKVDKFLHNEVYVVKTLDSAGVTNSKKSSFIASRKAFRDADRSTLSAIAYKITGEMKYFYYAQTFLLEWSIKNIPTGHPINETRLESLIWTYSIICPDLENADRLALITYFNKLKTAKVHWQFGNITESNNHKTHHIKMLVLLNLVLGNKVDLLKTKQIAQEHIMLNLSKSGESIDYIQRDSLFYHVYNLEAWLEIELLTQCCTYLVNRAFDFSLEKIVNGKIGNEFDQSSVPIDENRSHAGFKYAAKNGVFDIGRFSRSQWVHRTITGFLLERPEYIHIKNEKLTFYILRKLLWKTS